MKLIKGNTDNLEEIYKYLCLSFPKDELKTKDDFLYLMNNYDYNLILAYEEELIGYIFYFNIKETNSIWLEYISIIPSAQNKGLGSKLFKEFCLYCKNYNGIYLEIEKPNGEVIRDRRKNFYIRLGVELIDTPYQMPSYETTIEMELMHKKISTSPTKDDVLKSIKSSFNNVHYNIKTTDKAYKYIMDNIKL